MNEDEVRLIYKDGANKLLKIGKEFFVDVTIGCQIPEEDEKEILEVIDAEFDKLSIYKAVLSEDSYSIKFEQIR